MNSNSTPTTNTMEVSAMENNYEKIGCHDAFVKISNKLEGRNIPDSFKRGLESLRNAGNKFQVYKCSIQAPDNADILKQVIGRNGCYFILTTQQCDLDFIWHNRDNNTIEFWGPKPNIDKALEVISSRITKYSSSMNDNNFNQDLLRKKVDSLDYVEDSGGGMVHRSWATEEECKAHDSKTQNGEMVPEHNGEEEYVSKLSGSESGDQ